MAKSVSAIYYQKNPAARRKKNAYQQEFNKQPSQVKKRVALNKYNRQQTALGNNKRGDGTDASHKGSKIVGYSSASRNRGDSNNSEGDKNSRNAKYRPGGKRKIIRRKK